MVFRRRAQLTTWQQVRAWIWPASGWQRASRYLMQRLKRLPGTPHSIAAGFACGAAMSFTPFVGLHIVLALLWAWALRGNLLAAAIGTIVGNPWTFPLIWLWIYEAGTWLLGQRAVDHAERLLITDIFADPWAFFWPMTVGAVPTAMVVWLLFYYPILRVVTAAREDRALRFALRRRERELSRQAPPPATAPVDPCGG